MKHILKRTLCLLLVLVMCLGMIPTVSAEEESVTISFASTAQRESQDSNKQVWKNGGVTMTNNKAASTTDVADYSNPARFYAGSNLVIEAPGNITKIVFDCNSTSYATAMKNSIGNAATASSDKVTVTLDGSSNTYTVSKLTAQVRMDSLTVTYQKAEDTPTPEQGQTYTVSFSVPAGVTAPAAMECNSSGITLPTVEAPEGYTFAGWTNSAVEDTDTAPTIYTGSYVAAADTMLYALYTYTVADGGSVEYVLRETITADDVVVITMTKGGTIYALPSSNGSSSAPSADVTVTVADGKISGSVTDTIKWTVAGDAANGYTFYANGDTSKALYTNSSNNGVRVGSSTNNKFKINGNYLQNTGTNRYIGIYNTQDWRCYTNTTGNIANQTLGLYVKSAGGTTYYTTLSTAACTHENTTDTTVDATCTAAGSVTTVCDDCGMTVDIVTIPATGHQNTTTTTVAATCTEAGSTTETCDDCDATVSVTAIPALGHALENGVCGKCGKEIPDYSGDYYIATKRTEGNYFYMTNDLGSASTKRYLAAEQSATLPESIVNGEADKTFTLILQDDGTYKIKTGESYLGWTSGNSGILVEKENALKLTVEVSDEGLFNIHFTGDEERYLSLNGTTGNDYFAFYKGTQKQDLSLIPVTECAHENTTTTTVDATCTAQGSTTVTCDDCFTVVSTQVIPMIDHSYADGSCSCGHKAAAQVDSAEWENTQWYTTVQQAVSAAPVDACVKLLGGSTEFITVDHDLFLDLNGFDLDGVTVTGNATLYAMDSTTDDYDCSDGYGTIAEYSGRVAMSYKATVNDKVRRYVACDEGGGALSFHRIYVGITSISLRPGASGMGYKATVAGDQKVIEMMDDNAIGMTLWVFGDYENAKTVYMTRDKVTENMMVITARVQGMDVALHGETVLCATVSVNLNGTTVTSSEAMYTLRQAVEAIAAAVNDGTAYTDAQMSALQDFCENNREAMSTWSNIDAILNRSAAQ